MVSRRSLRKRRTPLRVRSIDDEYDDVGFEEEEEEEEEVNDQNEKKGTSSSETGMQIVCFSRQPFTLPDDWIVEQRPRPSKPSHVDKVQCNSPNPIHCSSMHLTLSSIHAPYNMFLVSLCCYFMVHPSCYFHVIC